jgi:hypothetical protein
MAHKDRASVEFLREVRAHLDAVGWRVGNLDVTVLAEDAQDRAARRGDQAGHCRGAEHPARAGSRQGDDERRDGIRRAGEGIAVHATALIYQ